LLFEISTFQKLSGVKRKRSRNPRELYSILFDSLGRRKPRKADKRHKSFAHVFFMSANQKSKPKNHKP